jgi:hypothetical protein
MRLTDFETLKSWTGKMWVVTNPTHNTNCMFSVDSAFDLIRQFVHFDGSLDPKDITLITDNENEAKECARLLLLANDVQKTNIADITKAAEDVHSSLRDLSDDSWRFK